MTPDPAHVQIDALEPLLDLLELEVQEAVLEHQDGLEQIVMNVGRPLGLRKDGRYFECEHGVTGRDLETVIRGIGGFREDGRAGIDRTLHRISENRDRYGKTVGVRIRIGRVVLGVAEPLRSLLEQRPLSLLVLGGPGSGKSTLLRDMVRISGELMGADCIVVDTSNEVAGDGAIPHPALGLADRVQVPSPEAQAKIILQTLANHGPKRLIIDEIKRSEEADIAEMISHMGVDLIASAHAWDLNRFVHNPMYRKLAGYIDLNARHRPLPPAFSVMVELVGRGEVRVYRAAQAIDAVLAGNRPLVSDLGGVAKSVGASFPDHSSRMSRTLAEITHSLKMLRGKAPTDMAEELERLERMALEAELF
jgi:stage III sporulation protein SpoIIIAA